MTTRKYKSYGVRRENNLSDIEDKKQSLENLLNDLPGIDPERGITFISDDLNVVRGLKSTNIFPDSFIQLAGTSVAETVLEQDVDFAGNPITIETRRIIQPRIRLEDRFEIYRGITGEPPVFQSGDGPIAYFFESGDLPTITKGSSFSSWFDTNKASAQTSDEYWILGEFVVESRFRDFADEYGGVVWEGYHLPNPAVATQSFFYETSGLFQVEYDRFDDGNWQVVKSIYAKKRTVTVLEDAVDSETIVLQAGEGKYVSINDFLDNDPENLVVSLTDDTVTLTLPITVSANTDITFDMNLGTDDYSVGRYTFDEVMDVIEVPQIKKRIFWWFPDEEGYTPSIKYLRNASVGNFSYDFFTLSSTPADVSSSVGSVRELLETGVSPHQGEMGAVGNQRSFSTNGDLIISSYTPKSSLSQVTKASVNIEFEEGKRYIRGNLTATAIGNIIIPVDPADFGGVIQKDVRIKSIFERNLASPFRVVTQPMQENRTAYAVNIIDHEGLVDYFVASSTGDTVTVNDTSKLRKDMICITDTTGDTDFVRITEIVSPTQFKTSSNLSLSSAYLFVFANAGIIDRSLDSFCLGVFGQLTSDATSSGNQLQLVSVNGVVAGQVVQLDGFIPAGTTVSSVVGNTVTLSQNITASIEQGETIVFAPSGTSVNKEICVFPLNLAPPFVGIATGLDTDGKNIKSSLSPFNVRFSRLTIDGNDIVSSVVGQESYDRKITINNTPFSILAKKIV